LALNRPEVVFVDVGGVFHLPRMEKVTPAFAALGYEVDDAARLHRAHHAAMAELDRRPGVIDDLRENEAPPALVFAAYDRGLARALGVADEKLDAATVALSGIFGEIGAWGTLIPGSLDGLRALAATGVRLGVVSNSDGTVEERLRNEGVAQVGEGPGVAMEIIVDSGRVGFQKPDPRIFHFALEALGVTADRAWHVGDSVAMDVHGALAAGVTPIHLDPFGDCAGGPDHEHVRSLTELADRLRR
jgi:putative hydrolase of the HAD superfamily